MSDGGNTPGAVSEAIQTVNEAVVQPVKDELGEMIEAGVQAITGASDDPQKQALKQQKQQQKLADAQRQIQYWKQIESQQFSLRQQNQQQQMQKQQETKQSEQVKQYETQKKEVSKNQAVVNAQTSKETRKGVGG